MIPSLEIYLGVDGGQSSTKAIIGDAGGRVLGRGTAGPCNHVAAEAARAKFLATISACVSAARKNAGIRADVRFRAACFGMSGGPEDKEALLRQVVDAEQWLVTHDGAIALSGALAGEDGIVAIAGTGSIAYGRKGDRTMRAGGWGYVFGDEGSAFGIVREALRAALRHEEGWGWNTSLHAMLLKATGAKSANEVLHLFYTPEWPRSRVAELAVDVGSAAEQGDEMSATILQVAGGKLSQLVSSIQETLWAADEVASASYVGGVFRNRDVVESYRTALESTGKVRVRPPDWGADAGALIESYRLAGIRPSLREV